MINHTSKNLNKACAESNYNSLRVLANPHFSMKNLWNGLIIHTTCILIDQAFVDHYSAAYTYEWYLQYLTYRCPD